MRDSPKRPGGGGQGGKRAVILKAARRLFLENGFAATSVDAITAASGVSKPTVYSYFSAKEAILEAVVREEAEGHPVPVEFRSTGHTRRDLEAAVRALTALALAPELVAWDRVMSAEARRNPDLGRIFFDQAPGRVLAVLAGFLRDLGAAGGLDTGDGARAAEFFFGMVVGVPLLRRQLCGDEAPHETADARAAELADRFLRAYTPRPGPDKHHRKR